MAAGDGALRQAGQTAQHGQPGFSLNILAQTGGHGRSGPIKKYPRHLAGLTEPGKSLQDRRQGKGGAFRLRHQNGRGLGNLGHMPAAGPLAPSYPIIIAHNTLDDCRAPVLSSQSQIAPHFIGRGKNRSRFRLGSANTLR